MSVSHAYNQALADDGDASVEVLASILEKELKITRFGWRESSHELHAPTQSRVPTQSRWQFYGSDAAAECAGCEAASHLYYNEFLICADLSPAVAAEICVCMRDARSRQHAQETKQFYETELSNMCHAIRTPINGIFHLSDIENLADDKENLSYNLRHLRAACTTLVENLMDVVDYLKLRNGTLQFDAVAFDLAECLHGCVQGAQFPTDSAAEQPRKIDLNISPNLPQAIIGDPMRTKQIFMGMLMTDVVAVSVDTTVDIDEPNTDAGATYIHRVKFLFEVNDTAGKLSFLTDIDRCNDASFIAATTTECMQLRVTFRIIYMLTLRMGGSMHVKTDDGVYLIMIILPMREQTASVPHISIGILGAAADAHRDALAAALTSDLAGGCAVDISTYTSLDDLAVTADLNAIILLDDVERETVEKKYISSATAPPLIADLVTASNPEAFLASVHAAAQGRRRLLLVEDDKINCIVMLQILKKFAYEVDVVRSGEDAIAQIEKKEYNVYLLDVRLPGMSGQEVAKYLRGRPRTAATPRIIGVTAQLLESHEEFDRVLYKPIDIRELTEVLC